MQVVLSGFIVRLFCFVLAKLCMYFLAALVLVCVDVMVMSSAITERRDMGLYEVPLSLLCFGMRAMLAKLSYFICFRCLIFNLSGPCELLFLLVLLPLGPELW